jgi:anti-sigma B factor antagonist
MNGDVGLRIERGDHVRVHVLGDLDFESSLPLRAAFVDIAREEAGSVVVDLGATTFLDSTGLSVLLQGKRRFDEIGRPFGVAVPEGNVRRLLEIAGVLSQLEVG